MALTEKLAIRDVSSQYLSPEVRHSLIAGGSHTYSRGDDTFPSNAPPLLARGRGAYVWDTRGRRYLDWAMAVRSVSIGHANYAVDKSAFALARKGVNLSRPTPEEFALAERIIRLIPGIEMVKFGKNGSDATAAAIRLARSATGKDIILRSDQAAFLGVHDWFIGSTVMSAGIPGAVRELTRIFPYGDLPGLEAILKENYGRVAAVILEPLGLHVPPANYLRDLISLAHSYGAVVIFDEVVSGFRVGLSGYQGLEGVVPDLSAFGKAIANGYPLSVLGGKAELMELGGIRHERNRTFLMSSTYGPERASIGAALATLDLMEKKPPFGRNRLIMEGLMGAILENVRELGLEQRVSISGLAISPNITFLGSQGASSLVLKTAFMQEMLENGILTGNHLFSVAACHRRRELATTILAISRSLAHIRSRLNELDSMDEGSEGIVRPVFRQKN